MKPTEAGLRYLEVARRVLADLASANAVAGAELSIPRGLLTITAPLAFGARYVRPLVNELLVVHPEVSVRLMLLDRLVQVIDEGVDVAVRIAHLPDSALLATAVGEVRRVVCASPAYLGRHGKPRAPADLSTHRCISFSATTPSDTWIFGPKKAERARQVRVNPVFRVNVADAAIDAAVDGMGVVCALSYQVAPALERGALVRILTAFEPAPLPVHLVYPAAAAPVAKVRVFVALATPRLRKLLGHAKGA